MNCREASSLVGSSLGVARPWPRRAMLGLHLAMCRHCRRFWRQTRTLDRGTRSALAAYERDRPRDLAGRIVRRLLERAGI